MGIRGNTPQNNSKKLRKKKTKQKTVTPLQLKTRRNTLLICFAFTGCMLQIFFANSVCDFHAITLYLVRFKN